MSKEILQITIGKPRKFKTKFGKWFYNKIWFIVWYIWKPKVLSIFYGSIADFIYWLAPKSVKEEWDKEMKEFEFDIRIRTEEDESK